eukprot:scaffold14144_cov67-Attheya_sp.AAC.2
MLQTGESFGNDSTTVIEDFVTNSAPEMFYAWKLQKAIDIGASGALNHEAIDSICKVIEELGHYE